MEDSSFDEEYWDDLDDDWLRPPPITYREAVNQLRDLAKDRNDVQVRWDATQKNNGRKWRSHACIEFTDGSGIRILLKSALQLDQIKRIVASGIPLPENHAIWYQQEGIISSRLVGDFDQFHNILASQISPSKRKRLKLDESMLADLAGTLSYSGVFPVSDESNSVCQSLRLTSVPPDLWLLYKARSRRGLTPSLEISGISASSPAEAQKILINYGTSYLYSLARNHGASLRLWDTGYRIGSRKGPSQSKKLSFPKLQYDAEPVELFSAGNSVGRPALEQYLKFYQVLEYYIPKAIAYEVARQGVATQNRAKSPFTRPGTDRSLGIEGNQLDAVINMSVPASDCLKLLNDRDLFDTLSDPMVILHVDALKRDGAGGPIQNLDYREAISSRAYGIRNRIVHAKEGGGKRGIPPLRLHSREARDLTADLRVIRFLAQKALKHWATALPR